MSQPSDLALNAYSKNLCLQKVSLTLPTQGTPLLNQISWTVQPGQCSGLIGPSGAGKSCLLRLLNRLEQPTAGRILFQGQDIRQINIYHLRRQIMLAPAEPKLLGMTVERALIYPLELAKLPATEIQARRESWCDRLHLSSAFLQREELQLSNGERHWVSLARALMLHPQVLLLDEVLSALAPEQIDLFRAVQEQLQLTVILASRHRSLIQELCPQVVGLDRGTMIDPVSIPSLPNPEQTDAVQDPNDWATEEF
jgi:D-methionine transport system ATP-binding protein